MQCYEQVTSGGSGARAKVVKSCRVPRDTWITEDIVHTDQATVSGCVGWISQTGAVGHHEPNGGFEKATCNGGRADVDLAWVAGSTAEVTRETFCIWADVEPAKLYAGVGQSDLDFSIADIMQPAYFGQENQLQAAAPTQAMSSFDSYPPPVNMGTGAVSVPSWNHLTGSWERAPHVQSTRVQLNVSAERWEAGFMLEARGTRPSV